MKCEELRREMPDLAAGLTQASDPIQEHLRACAPCAAQFEELRQTMVLMDEWEAPEPSVYFDTRLQARLREQKAMETVRGPGWFGWLPRPAMAMAGALLLAVGVGIWQFGAHGSGTGDLAVGAPTVVQSSATAERGTAVGDLQTLDNDNDLYADFDVLDDIDSQQNAQPATN